MSDRKMVIIGTSGSTDYLKDATADRRFWPVSVALVDTLPVSPEDRAVVQRLMEVTAEVCDGLHDEGAPARYLCSRCFPDLRGDLVGVDNADDYQDEPEEME